MTGPRANFVCLSPKCHTETGATVYELPVSATRCAVCGSKRVKRLFDAINVSSGLARQVDRLAEPAVTAAYEQKSETRRLRAEHGMVHAVPMKQLPQKLAEVYAAGGMRSPVRVDAGALGQKAQLGGTIAGDTGSLMGGIKRQAVPRTVAYADREFKIVRGKDGAEVEKA